MATNFLLRLLIAEPWTSAPDAVIGADWLAATAASPSTTESDLRLMVQSLLKERMRLFMHMSKSGIGPRGL